MLPERFRTPLTLLMLMSIAMPLTWATWESLLNNFVVERAGFTGAEIGMLHSLREVPGFLAFTVVFVLLVLREQTFAILALAVMGIGVVATGLLPTVYGLYFTTVVMSTGFHYFETLKQSLSLQWFDKLEAPRLIGRLIATAAATSLLTYGAIWLLFEQLGLDYVVLYALAGGICLALAAFMALAFPPFPAAAEQNTHLVLRSRYGLYYLLTFLSGARRQIFTVFAIFMLVEKFGYSAGDVALLMMFNHLVSFLVAERVGGLVIRFGERAVLTLEYLGLIGVFTAYALVTDPTLAAGLYVIDHVFFAMAIAINTYFQKIADPADLASSAGVSFTINHIAAVVIPALLGLVWLHDPALVFLTGTGIALCSLIASQFVPRMPDAGNEWRMPWGLDAPSVRVLKTGNRTVRTE